VVATGGVFAWHDGRENADTFQALLEYPGGFLVSYATSFGNDSTGSTRYMGKKATLINIGDEGSPRYQVVEEKGNHEDDSTIDKQRKSRYLLLPHDKGIPPMAGIWRTGLTVCAAESSRTRRSKPGSHNPWRA